MVIRAATRNIVLSAIAYQSFRFFTAHLSPISPFSSATLFRASVWPKIRNQEKHHISLRLKQLLVIAEPAGRGQ
jgi:hypothetical protein